MTHPMNDEEVRMLRKELELLMGERQALMRVLGAAAAFVAELDSERLPRETYEAAELLAEFINEMPEDALREALQAVHAHIVPQGAPA